MAIKGKTKGRSRRVVAAPPRPPMYVRKKPIVRRPWFLANVSEGPGLKGPGATRLVLVESQYLINQSFLVFQNVGQLMSQAATLHGKARTDLVDQAKALATSAQNLFRRGYQKIQTLRSELGTIPLNSFAPSSGGGLGGA